MKLSDEMLEKKRVPLAMNWEYKMTREEVATRVARLERVAEVAEELVKAEHCGLIAYRYVNDLEDALKELEE